MLTNVPIVSSRSSFSSSDSCTTSSSAPTLQNVNMSTSPSQTSVPVTILTGFLGSGKTTLLQYILSSREHNFKIAVIENEFAEGTLNIESLIARDGANDSLTDLIELPNGCVCCTVKDSLVETLENLLTKRDDLDYILIEASGMANPGPITSIFWLDEALESRLRLDGVIALVDAKNILMQLEATDEEGGEAARQIAYADRILLNKIDLVENKELEKVEFGVRKINPTAEMTKTNFCKLVDLGWILNVGCFDMNRSNAIETAFDRATVNGNHTLSCNSKCNCTDFFKFLPPVLQATSSKSAYSHNGKEHSHTSSVETVTCYNKGSVSLKLMHSWMATILWPDQDKDDKELKYIVDQTTLSPNTEITPTRGYKQMQIFRVKGILSIYHLGKEDFEEEEPQDVVDSHTGLDSRRFILQAVNDLWEIQPASNNLKWTAYQPIEERCCKLVIIGRWLDKKLLEDGFQACFENNGS